MQHRAMSLMSKKMAAALALEGEFSEEGLAAMAGEGDEQMALAKSMSEKIDDADMQRSWSKVKSLTEKRKPPKKKSIPTLADMAADAKPDKLDTLEAEAQLLARTILERQKKPVPASAMPDIISLSERFVQADEGMWNAARAMAFREEPLAEFIVPATADRPKDEGLVGNLTVTNCERSVLIEGDNKIVTAGQNDVIKVTNEASADDAGLEEAVVKSGESTTDEVAAMLVKLRLQQPEEEKKVHAVVDDFDFDETLIAKMFANLAAHGMTLQDLAG
jgi:hypothetical protein